MTARDIIRFLVRSRWHDNFCLPNYTPAKWWECDVFELTKRGYMREYEVKISRADFFADAKKECEIYSGQFGVPGRIVNKHQLLQLGDPIGPVQFWYVTPVGMIEQHELPVWAGLIEIHPDKEETDRISYETETVSAPRIHREKCGDDVRKHALGVCYYRMHELLRKPAA